MQELPENQKSSLSPERLARFGDTGDTVFDTWSFSPAPQSKSDEPESSDPSDPSLEDRASRFVDTPDTFSLTWTIKPASEPSE
jgi:hypothetical protein